MRMLSAFSSVRIVWIRNGEVARFRKNHSVVVSSLVVALDPGDPALLVLYFSIGLTLGARFHRRSPVAYSEIWYSGFGWIWSKFVIAASKACIALTVLGDLGARDLEVLIWLMNL